MSNSDQSSVSASIARVRDKIVPIWSRMQKVVSEMYDEIAQAFHSEFSTLPLLEAHSSELKLLIAPCILEDEEFQLYRKEKSAVQRHETHERHRLQKKVNSVWRKLLARLYKVVNDIVYDVVELVLRFLCLAAAGA